MPIARLFAAFISVVERKKPMYSLRTKQSCSACGAVASAKREKEWNAIHVFGVPVFTWKRFVTMSCSQCGTVFQKQPATFIQSALWFVS
ncbi:MAG: zinc-ribbon domain-containing protein [Patescibacteria group bacterium]